MALLSNLDSFIFTTPNWTFTETKEMKLFLSSFLEEERFGEVGKRESHHSDSTTFIILLIPCTFIF